VRQLLIHVGLPKTATTFLQFSIFENLASWRHVYRTHGEVESALCGALRTAVRAKGERLELAHRALVDNADRLSGPRTRLLVSHEPISVGAAEVWRERSGPNPTRAARRLADAAAMLPCDSPPKVLIGVRRQDEWLGARYAESCGRYPELTQEGFAAQVERLLESEKVTGSFAFLAYERVYNRFVRYFGAENVLMLPMELLAVRPRKAAAMLADFLGDEQVIELHRKAASDTRHRNGLRREGLVWTRRDGTGTIELPSCDAARIREFFRSRNKKFSAAVGIDLEELGYY
jgi:hypothetical protein